MYIFSSAISCECFFVSFLLLLGRLITHKTYAFSIVFLTCFHVIISFEPHFLGNQIYLFFQNFFLSCKNSRNFPQKPRFYPFFSDKLWDFNIIRYQTVSEWMSLENRLPKRHGGSHLSVSHRGACSPVAERKNLRQRRIPLFQACHTNWSLSITILIP